MVESFLQFLKHPEWRGQHRWRRAIWASMARLGLTGLHGLPVNRRWVEIHRRAMPMENLPAVYDGLRLVQMSDLHFSPVVGKRYLQQHVAWVNDLQPDLIVVTGDLITGGYRYARGVANVLFKLRAAYGVIVTFGNHDYGLFGKNHVAEGRRRADHLERHLESHGLIVLRNELHRLKLPGADRPLVLVGLDDEWSGQIDPDRAFQGLTAGEPIICLNHNPANCRQLLEYPWQWMLSGHTHGRAIATSRIGRRLYGHRYRHFTHGYYAVEGRHLYVNRGLSYGQRIHHWCRPELTVFRLTPAGPQVDPAREEIDSAPRSPGRHAPS